MIDLVALTLIAERLRGGPQVYGERVRGRFVFSCRSPGQREGR